MITTLQDPLWSFEMEELSIEVKGVSLVSIQVFDAAGNLLEDMQVNIKGYTPLVTLHAAEA